MSIKLPHISWIILSLAIAIIGLDIGMLTLGIPWSAQETYLKGLVGQTLILSGTIQEDPDTSESRTSYRLGRLRLGGDDAAKATSMESAKSSAGEVPGVIFVSGARNRELKRSDRVTILGKMNSGFGVFAGVFYRPKVLRLKRNETDDIALLVRDFFASHVRNVIPEQEAALGLGYLLGVRSSLPEGLAETLKTVGLTHIIVASGANLSILIGFARRALGKVSRLIGLVGSIVLVLFYIGMVGLSPSMVRAGIVSILSLMAWYVGRKFAPGRLLIIVAATTLVYNPMYLIDIGWLLSFGSFAGVMIVGPCLTSFFYGTKKPGLIGATLLETLAASLVCTPILLYFFGSMSLISLLANLLVLPTISPAMALCFGAGVFGVVGLAPLAGLIGKIATLLLSYHLWVINFFGAQKSFVVAIPTEQPWVFLSYAPVIILVSWKTWRDRLKRRGREFDSTDSELSSRIPNNCAAL
jgi:competence protein ComEC